MASPLKEYQIFLDRLSLLDFSAKISSRPKKQEEKSRWRKWEHLTTKRITRPQTFIFDFWMALSYWEEPVSCQTKIKTFTLTVIHTENFIFIHWIKSLKHIMCNMPGLFSAVCVFSNWRYFYWIGLFFTCISEIAKFKRKLFPKVRCDLRGMILHHTSKPRSLTRWLPRKCPSPIFLELSGL